MIVYENKRLIFFTALFAALLTAACTPPFPQQMLDRVDRNLSFKELQKNPDAYKGTWVLLGGTIVTSRNTKEGTMIELLQRPLGRSGRPLQTDATEGRLLIVTEEFLDAAIYHGGRELSVIGEVSGQKMQPLGETEYRYPLVLAKSLHLWDPSSGPRVSFGIGIGVSSYH
jgi:outer membrane lipoprotein